MRPKNITAYNLRNVVFLGPSPFDSYHYKRENPKIMTLADKENLVTFEACNHRAKGGKCYCDQRCVWAVIKRTPSEVRSNKNYLKQIYPSLKT